MNILTRKAGLFYRWVIYPIIRLLLVFIGILFWMLYLTLFIPVITIGFVFDLGWTVYYYTEELPDKVIGLLIKIGKMDKL